MKALLFSFQRQTMLIELPDETGYAVEIEINDKRRFLLEGVYFVGREEKIATYIEVTRRFTNILLCNN